MGTPNARNRPFPARICTLQFILLVLVSIISYGALLLPQALQPVSSQIQVGEVAPNDFQAPKTARYPSEVKTNFQRDAAESTVQAVYGLPDPAVARRQIERLRAALQYITLVRTDPNASLQQKKDDIAAISDVNLPPQTVDQILALTPARWDPIQQEALNVLEQVMRRSIRDQEMDTVIRSIPSLVSLSLDETQASIISELVGGFVTPNSFYNKELTEGAKQAAREAVQPVYQEYKAGEIIVSRGQIVSAAQLEALRFFGLIEEPNPWQDYAGAGALVVMLAALVWLYFSRRRLQFLYSARSLVVVAVLFLLFVTGARLVIPDRTILPYAFPLAGLGLLLATLFGLEVGIVFSIIISLLVPYNLPNAFDLMPYYLLSALTGVLVLGAARRVWSFFRAGAAVAGAAIAMLLAFRVPYTTMDAVAIVQLAGAALFSGLAAASLALILQYFLAQTLGLTTALQLIEISRPDFPLLQFFLRNAPGTYQHSLQVANLAEQAAELIGADALLTRVGALFHDVGKSMNPAFFIENQPQGELNTHEDIDPAESAATIISHVTDGVALARKYRLPRRIDDFILEHHGSMLTRYQYSQAVEAAGGDKSKVDERSFHYPGPAPRSRETALLMLADGCEARTRAERPQDEESMRRIVLSTIEFAQKSGQLDNTQLTLRDLSLITDAFVNVLRGTHHPRISYPKETPATMDVSTAPAKK
jgi:cyclic-di-AMP phosphodiesterase PgpH